ncbi:Fructose-1-6-bisphosphatase-like protein [Elsinoe fawcettii]|nr:Fructose-1-6-bisphosphatase-like protein [Elsinoe fawcettii]
MSKAFTTQDYEQLRSFLDEILPSSRPALKHDVVPSLLQSIQRIAATLRSSHQVSQVGTANAFGDDQLNVDVAAEDIIREAIVSCTSVAAASSEEDPVEKKIDRSPSEDSREIYTLAFDPLDGSSIIAPNWAVGTIIGIWEGQSALYQTPDKQIAAILGVYGPRTTAVVAVRLSPSNSITFEVGIDEAKCSIIHKRIQLAAGDVKTRYFAPANLRAAAEDSRYMDLVNQYISNKFTLRYSGGLVPDVIHALVKGHGIYISPTTEKSKAKLRRLYELAPIALIIEGAGGKAVDSATGQRILDKEIRDCDERAGIICGTAEEVDFAIQRLDLTH